MKNLLRLVKINSLTLFDFYKIKNAKTKKDKSKELRKFLLIIIAFFYLGGFIYYYARLAIKGLITINMANILMPVGFSLVSAYILFMTIFRINKTIFDSKDYSLLLSLPIKKSTIISSKLIMLYLVNIIYSTMFLLPIYIAYLKVPTNIMFHVNFWLSFFFVSLVPTVIGAVIGTLFTGISSKLKHKNFFNIVLNLVFILVIIFISYSSQKFTSVDMANINKSIMNFVNNIYPLANLYQSLLSGNILSLLLFIIISTGCFISYKYFMVLFFDRINSNLSEVTIKRKYNDKNNKVRSIRLTLLRKEIKKYFSSTIYFLNTAMGSILLTAATIFLVIMGPKNLGDLLNIKELSKMLNTSLPLVFSLFCALSCTTFPSISLEGKSLWILKSMPIKIKDIFISKISLNLLITIPLIIFNGTLITIYLHLSFITFLLLILTPLMYTIFIAGFGLYLNLLMPDFEWTSEVKVIKQSFASFLTIFISLFLVIIPLGFSTDLNSNLFISLICLVMLVLNIILYSLLFTKGKKKFELL